MSTIVYEANNGKRKTVRGEWVRDYQFKADDGRWLEIVGNCQVVRMVRTPTGGFTQRRLGYIAAEE